jgi:hypothetical protein
MKRCTACKKTKDESEFYSSARSADKLQYECKSCSRRRVKKYRKLCKEQGLMNYSQRTRQRLRLNILQHYGGLKPVCACCGEDHIEFLSVDHIKGGGAKHKKLLGAGFYDWLKKNNYPPGYRILCHNCNQSLGSYGYCPHQKPNARPYCPPKRIYKGHYGKKSRKNVPV